MKDETNKAAADLKTEVLADVSLIETLPDPAVPMPGGKGQRQVTLLDTTLRDGMQAEGISFSVEDKVRIARALDRIGIPYIEAGNPASNPKDLEFFRAIAQKPLQNSILCAFGSTRRKDLRPSEDTNLLSLVLAETPAVTIFGKSWDLHVEKVLQVSLQDNLAMIRDTIAFLKDRGKTVIFDAEHFFDGWKANPDYAGLTLEAALEGGADVACLCDTNGATYFTDIADIVANVYLHFPGLSIGVHTHNDTGLAVAQALSAVDAGATHVQGTFIGYGERCGNCNLSTIIGDLQLKRGIEVIPEECMPLLTQTALRIAEISNVSLPSSMPYVGKSAFAHKGGMHIDGVKKIRSSFEHVPPKTVGNSRRYLTSEVSGKAAVLELVQSIDPQVEDNDPILRKIVNVLKERELAGYQYEAAEQSFELLIRRMLHKYRPYYRLDYFKVLGEQPLSGEELMPSSAVVKVHVGDDPYISGAEGVGPVAALDKALRGALSAFYPTLREMSLTDFKVRVLDRTTSATVRVLIESSDGNNKWTTVGVSSDIIEAAFLALSDSIEYKLMLDEVRAPY